VLCVFFVFFVAKHKVFRKAPHKKPRSFQNGIS
jgi:hypothetical protein